MVSNGRMSPRVYFTAPNIHNDANLTITIIQRVLSCWSSDLPRVLYMQLENTSRENKDHIVIGYQNILVESRIFQSVKVGFLLVGHTHYHIDQMLNYFAFTLKRKLFCTQ